MAIIHAILAVRLVAFTKTLTYVARASRTICLSLFSSTGTLLFVTNGFSHKSLTSFCYTFNTLHLYKKLSYVHTRSMLRKISILFVSFGTTAAFGQAISSLNLPGSNLVASTSPAATVTLAAPSIGSTSIVLTSSSSSVGFSTAGNRSYSITFTSGQTTANVPLVYSPGTDPKDVQIIAQGPSNTLISHTGVVPSNQTTLISNLTATSGPGQVHLEWSGPPASISGVTYNIYSKLTIGTMTHTMLLASGWRETFYTILDAALPLTYTVVPVLPDQSAQPGSSIVCAPLSGTTTLAVQGVPTSTVSGDFSVSLANSSGFISGTVLVDGAAVASMTQAQTWYGIQGASSATVDTSLLANGQHSLQVYSVWSDGSKRVSPVYSFSSQNAVSIRYHSQLSEPGFGSAEALVADLTSAENYTVDILNADGNVIKSTSGYGSSINYVWDGTDSTGQSAPSDQYQVRLTIASAIPFVKVIPIYRLRSGPNFIALLAPVNDTSVNSSPFNTKEADNVRRYGRVIVNALRSIQSVDPYYDGMVFVCTDGKSSPVFDVNLLRWMKTARAFYYYGHSTGVEDATQPNGGWTALFFGNSVICSDAARSFGLPGHKISSNNFYVNGVLNTDPSSPYNFVWLDSCCTKGGGLFSGGTINDRIGPVNNQWVDAFGANCFIGTDGLSGSNTNTDLTDSYWFNYRKRFWYRMGLEDYVSRALGYAAFAPGSNMIMPQDSNGSLYRLSAVDGDTTLP